MLNFFSTSTKRQKPTRMPYSCQAQLGRSGCSGCPYGGGSTVRGMLRSIDHSSTLTMVHTATRAPPGSLSGGRSTMAEYGTRSLGSFIGQHPTDFFWGRLGLPLEEGSMLKPFRLAAIAAALALGGTATAQTVGFATLPPGSILHAQASV